jgi:hypothetical protein
VAGIIVVLRVDAVFGITQILDVANYIGNIATTELSPSKDRDGT